MDILYVAHKLADYAFYGYAICIRPNLNGVAIYGKLQKKGVSVDDTQTHM